MRVATRDVQAVSRRMPRLLPLLGSSISWAVAGGLAAWAAARVTGADRVDRIDAPLTALLSFTPQAAAAAPLAALGLRAARQRRPAVTAALAATALVAVTGSRAIRRSQPKASGPVLRVLTVNVLCGRADAEAVVALVRQTGADVLFLQELTDDAVARLAQAGLDDLMPQRTTELRGSSLGSGIYSRFPLDEGRPLAPAHAAQPTAVLKLPGGEAVELGCVHPRAPLPSARAIARWRQELGVLPPPAELPRVLAGDFNATLDHAPLRGVLRLGYADAARQVGNALAPTWGPLGRPALITIDHVLVDRRCAVLASSVHVIGGTDHRAVYAEIRLPELTQPRGTLRRLRDQSQTTVTPRFPPHDRSLVKNALLAVPLLAAGVLAAGCAASSTSSTAASASSSSGASGASAAATSAASSAASTSASASGAASSSPAASGTPACSSADLKVSLGGGAGAGMSQNHIGLQLRNVGSSSCTVYGYPGVSWVAGSDGHQVGAAAQRQSNNSGSAEQTVTLAPGALASAPLDIVDAAVIPAADCKPVPVRGLRVYPPGQTAALFLPLPTASGGYGECSLTTKPATLTIGYLQAGAQPGGGDVG